MSYYLINCTFADGHVTGPQLQAAIDEHLNYLESGFISGQIIFSGPKVGTEGGLILIKGDRETIQSFCDNDPLVKAGIQLCQIIEFNLYKSQKYLEDWFK